VGSNPSIGTMKVQVQVKDLTKILNGMDPNAVIFEYDLTPEEIIARVKEKQLEGWLQQVRREIKEVGIEAYMQVAKEQAAPVLES
jgi:hypothetical protein